MIKKIFIDLDIFKLESQMKKTRGETINVIMLYKK